MPLFTYLFGHRSLGIRKNDFVLEIGSGSNPSIRSDVLLDRSIEPFQRAGQLVKDRPTVIADAQLLPFQNNSFDYILSIHILEHLDDPARLLEEIQRVAKRGYIETPSPFTEMIFGHRFHKWFVYMKDGILTLERKRGVNERLCNLMNYYSIHNRNLKRFLIS